MEIDEPLNALLRATTPDDAAYRQGMDRAERVGGLLRNSPELGVIEFEIGGSCAKQTALSPVKDVDLFLYLDATRWQTRGDLYKPVTVLGRVRDRLEQYHAQRIKDNEIQVRVQDHSVGLLYQRDGAVAIEIVPAMLNNKRDDDRLALIPERSSSEWRSTSVRRQRALLDKHDGQTRHLRRGIRLLKCWKNGARVGALKSYALEVLAIHVASQTEIRHPRAVLLGVLDYIRAFKLQQVVIVPEYHGPRAFRFAKNTSSVIMDPAVKDNNVALQIYVEDRQKIVTRARETLEDLQQAEDHFRAGRQHRGNASMKRAFGGKYLF